MSTELNNRHPGISRDMHGTNNLDVALRGAGRPNSPSSIGHLAMRVGKVSLKERLN